jgi:large subunit ribosomal protein L24
VEVLAGKDAGKRGKVLVVLRDKGRVIVQGVGFIKRHTRPNPQRNIKGGIAEREAAIHVSNVMIVSGDDDKRTRIGFKTLADGRKVRISRRSGELLDK